MRKLRLYHPSEPRHGISKWSTSTDGAFGPPRAASTHRFFFRSLAQDQRENAICIVLSGTGSDGALGVRAIKAEGGMVMVQTPSSTEYDGMPRSALATGLVDFELSPSEMPARLISYVNRAFHKPIPTVSAPETQSENAINKIFILLRTQTGHDFSRYKPSTIHRRIVRRMDVHQIETLDSYVKYLQQTPTEIEALFRDLLIGVTKFFRDTEAFNALEEQIIPKIFADKATAGVIRVWSPGCSTGEEAYSLAILLAEYREKSRQHLKLQIFGTDIDSNAIVTARAGLYPSSIAHDISPERLARFFTPDPNSSMYRIRKEIRDLLVFSEQNVIKDPPFSKVDLISCRNLLIYMSGELQKKLIPLFHYALNPNGYLFLGTSEAVGEPSDLFAALDRKQKIYQRQEVYLGTSSGERQRLLPAMTAMSPAIHPLAGQKLATPEKQPLKDLTEQSLLQQIAPAAALVNAQGDILYLHGRTGMYLEPSPGAAGINNILRMAREGLEHDLTIALYKATQDKQIVRCSNLRVKTNGDFTAVTLTIRPVVQETSPASAIPLFLVILEESGPAPALLRDSNEDPIDDDASIHISSLQQELRAKEEFLQTANEELRSSNEEMQSINEELQSTNEELETSKEELQSVNEELAIVNAELQARVAELTHVNNDLSNLLAGTGIGTVFLDYNLRILRFTPAVTQIFNLIPSDVGRPLQHIVSNLVGYNRIITDAQIVLDSLIPKEVEVQSTTGDWYSMRILPYRTLENVIEGAVITVVDVSVAKKTQAALHDSEERYRSLFSSSPDAIFIDRQNTIVLANPPCMKLFGAQSEAELLGKSHFQLFHPDFHSQIKERIEHVRETQETTELEELRALRLDGSIIDVDVIGAPVAHSSTKEIHFIIRDITERKQAKSKQMESRPGGIIAPMDSGQESERNGNNEEKPQ